MTSRLKMESMLNRTIACLSHFRFLRLSSDVVCLRRLIHFQTGVCQRSKHETSLVPEEEFRKFEIPGLKLKVESARKQRRKRLIPPPRYQQMRTDQEWIDVWPAAQTFKWSVVPFPVRQGKVETATENEGVVPSKYANAELMKIPNFLHLTPAHIKKHCAVLKDLCTPWPAGLETDELCRKYFPAEVQTSDYVFSGPSLRDPRARTVTLRLRLSDLKLGYHARDKFIRLAGDCYKPATDEIIFVSERCPLKKQNYDYALYLLTAIYHESWKSEAWEAEKTWDDMERYFWDISKSKETIIQLLRLNKQIDTTSSVPVERKMRHVPDDVSEESLLAMQEVKSYREAVSDLMNNGESDEALARYGQAVRRLLRVQGGLAS